MGLSAFDTHGRGFVRAVLNDRPSVETLAALQHLLEVAGARCSVYTVAAELGVILPTLPLDAGGDGLAARRAAPPAKARTRAV